MIGGEKQCYLQVAFRRACNGPYVRIGSLDNDFRGGAYRDYTQMFIFWTKPGFRYECILAKTHPKHPKMRLEPATCLQHPPTSTFTCTTNPYAYTQRIWECVIQFWLSYNMFGFYRIAGTRMTAFTSKAVKLHLGISLNNALLHKTKWLVGLSVLLRSLTYNLVSV